MDLLINTGVDLDRNISEPAIAALIQEDVGRNPGRHPGGGQGTFYFDVRNGACGLLTGIYLADGMLASETIKLGMVVAADADPDPGISEGFGFPAAGGAVLLSADQQGAGFTAFRFATFPEFADLFQSEVSWDPVPRTAGPGCPGRNILTVKVADSYATRAAECAEATTRELAVASALDLGDVGLLVATASVPGFAGALAKRLGISAGRVASLPGSLAWRATRPPPLWRWSLLSSQPRARPCSSPQARGSRWSPRSTAHEPKGDQATRARRQRVPAAISARPSRDEPAPHPACPPR